MENTNLSLSERFARNIRLSWLAAAAIMFLAALLGWNVQTAVGQGSAAVVNYIPAGEIFKNNISMLGLNLMGTALLGIPNLICALMNGYSMGGVFSMAVGEYGIGWFFTDILPHGILEIPVILAGVSAGILPWLMIASRIYRPDEDRRELGKCALRYLLKLALICSAALAAAALIESHISMAG